MKVHAYDRIPPLSGGSQYRPDIDGLRAIAVLAVIGYHAFPLQFSGGFVGVDVFFVISGYLIAKIIFQEMLSENFTITGFYARRINRIFPALILVTFISFLLGWYFLPPQEFSSLGSNIAGGSIFLQNIVLLNQVGYFDLAADKKPLLHLWSLGIEEQYYIVWPLLLFGMWRWKLKIIPITASLAAISFLLGCFLVKKHSVLAFYLPFSRCWELLLGAALALELALDSRKPAELTRRNAKKHNIYAFIATCFIIYCFYRFKQQTHYPGYRAFIPVCAALLFISSNHSWLNRKFLSSRGMVFIGLISYPLYLWHFPIIAYAKILSADSISTTFMCVLVLLSFFLATLTYFLIEKPLRFGGKHPYKIALLLIGMAIMGILGFWVEHNDGIESRLPPLIHSFIITGKESVAHYRLGSCLLRPEQGASAFSKTCSTHQDHQPLLFIWGDSYAAALYPGLNSLKTTRKYTVAEFTASGCPPFLGYTRRERIHCKAINDFILKQVANLHPEVVLLHSTWQYPQDSTDKGLNETVTALKALKIPQIVLVGPVPTWKGNGLSENVLAYYFANRVQRLLPERTTYRLNLAEDNRLDLEMRKRAEHLGIKYVSALEALCNSNGCLARTGKNGAELTAFDNGHLTLAGSTLLAQAILPHFLGESSEEKVLL